MCGVAGFCDFNKSLSKQNLVDMTNSLTHRGPDSMGINFFNRNHCNIGLGHRRLSIIDLTNLASQPMFDSTNKYAIVYNGEVYNFKEFQHELEDDGIKLISNSDTEVILNLYIKYGDDFIHKLIGMFAIVIYDSNKNLIKLFIDRAGIKPLYYSFDNGLLLFGSELKTFFPIKQFKKDIDLKSLELYFQYSYIPSPYSIFKNVFKVKPGHFIEFNISKKQIKQVKYWDVSDFYNKPKINKNYHELKNEVHKILKSAFNYRMISDVPVGIFLSGGYDSTAVASILQKTTTEKIKTFSIGFDEDQINEAPYAKKIADHLGTEHYEYYISSKDVIKTITELSVINDEPLGDVSSIPTYLVSKFAKQHVKVVLSGDGGDEIFGGYYKYFIGNKVYKFISKIPYFLRRILYFILKNLSVFYLEKIFRIFFNNSISNFAGKLEKFINILSIKKADDVYKISNQYFLDKEVKKLILNSEDIYKTEYDNFSKINGDFFDRAMCIDFKTYMYQILIKVDRASMATSIESREPLLDHRIIEYMASIISSLKLKHGPKGVLKDIVYEYVPASFMDRPKQGFVPPFENWLRYDLKDIVDECVNEDFLRRQNIFNISEVNKIKADFYNKNRYSYKLWLFIIFQLWYKEWIDEV